MIRDITIGQYYPSDSVIHRLDPRTKIIATFVFIISLFLFQGIWAYVVVSAALAALILTSRIPFSYVVKGLKSIVILLLITVFCNLLFTPGTTAFAIWKIRITWEGLRMSGYMGVRLLYLIIGSSFMTFTTTPNQLTDGLESLLNPLKAIKVPVHEIAMMISIALRFIPILIEETDKIMKAQAARGADFESGSIVHRVKNMIPILVPLFVSAFRRANDLAMAMEARCYKGGEGRTKMKPLKYHGRDAGALCIMVIYIAVLCIVS